jgi:hypothetical protein
VLRAANSRSHPAPDAQRRGLRGIASTPVTIFIHAVAQEKQLSTYLDIHDLPGVKSGDVAAAHEADVRVGKLYGVDYRHYWVDEEAGKVFCLVDAPDRETAARVHREAHGLEAHTLHEVEQGA